MFGRPIGLAGHSGPSSAPVVQGAPPRAGVTISCEDSIDYEEAARAATEAFDSPGIVIHADQMQWFYERCFSLGTTVISLREGARKVGQLAMVRQGVLMYGAPAPAAQLVDLFIAKEFRSSDCLRLLYGEVERQCMAQKIRFAFGMPNAKATPVNAHFFKMRPFLSLPIRVGLAAPLRSSALIRSGPFAQMKKADALALLARYRTSSDENGLQWDGDKLYQRLRSPRNAYGIHATQDPLLISSTRSTRGVRYTVLCGFFVRPGARATPGNVRALVRAACRLWKQPLFIYVGFNNALPANPGFALPGWLRPSPMVLQLRNFEPERPEPRFDRYQILDFDFA
jgi:hypothetical protein